MSILDKTAEIRRMKNAFEQEAGKFHDLSLRLLLINREQDRPMDSPRSPNHLIMLWQYYGVVDGDTSIDNLFSNMERSNLKWGLYGAQLSLVALLEGEACPLFVRMAERAGCLFDAGEARLVKARTLDEIMAGERQNLSEGKPVGATNDNPIAVWINFLLYHLSIVHPGREHRNQVEPEPFALSLLALERLEEEGGITKIDRSLESISKINFRVALSFPGECRSYVASVAKVLRNRLGLNQVFYDHDYQAQLARPNMDVLLQRIYREQSTLVVVFLCAEYAKKEWCGLEWRAIRDMIKNKLDDKIMFVRFDDSEVPGVFSTDGYVDARSCAPVRLAELIVERVHEASEENSGVAET